MKDVSLELDDVCLDLAKLRAKLAESRIQCGELERLIEDKLKILMSSESDGSHAIEISAHAFKQIYERLEALAFENDVIYEDFADSKNFNRSLSFPTNFKCFILTLVASAKKKGSFSKEPSKNTANGFEFRYNIEIKKWSNEKRTLQFTCIVENGNIKTGYFNWL